MNVLFTILSFALICGILLSPFLIFKYINKRILRGKFIVYLVLGILITTGLIFLFAWWTTFSDEILLSNYGYNFEGLNEVERYENVNPENLKKVKEIEVGLSGIGWLLKAFFGSISCFFYLLAAYFIIFIVKKSKATN